MERDSGGGSLGGALASADARQELGVRNVHRRNRTQRTITERSYVLRSVASMQLKCILL